MSAKELRAYRTLSSRLVKIQERGSLIGNLLARGVGFKEEEDFLRHEQAKFRTSCKYGKKKEIITLVMEEKMRDNRKNEGKVRKLRDSVLRKIENSMGRHS